MKYLRSALALIVFSGSVFGNDSSLSEGTYSLVNNGISYSLTGDALNGTAVTTLDNKTVYVGLTAWSDTGNYDARYDKNGSGDWQVKNQGRLNNYGSGFGLVNDDSYARGDQYGDRHTIDNYRYESGYKDRDMVLLSFSEAVSLTGSQFSYVNNYGSGQSSKEITVAGLNDISMFEGNSSFSWRSLANSSSVINSAVGHYSVSDTKAGNYYHSSFGTLPAAKYWLVGAYNVFFDPGYSQNKDFGFKLSSIGFSIANETPDVDVSEPGAFALMSLGLGLLLYRRKRRV
ncbi:exosortase-dependent surface protein XDP1 [Alteromonas sp. 009811495]|uniref:exosortase-dependent surface protein XDP1 n=1 Tax=Alteromonas sp. 009811495 TaxID=3002962 RepID=UPI00237DBC9D|nr:exosortase-dependent surface protein XDP1 [Alteromonas sp. 009811495]WDT84847.1 PEP-CTERM sorting domain-containing protein [Alteromonas sp. 009811495]